MHQPRRVLWAFFQQRGGSSNLGRGREFSGLLWSDCHLLGRQNWLYSLGVGLRITKSLDVRRGIRLVLFDGIVFRLYSLRIWTWFLVEWCQMPTTCMINPCPSWLLKVPGLLISLANATHKFILLGGGGGASSSGPKIGSDTASCEETVSRPKRIDQLYSSIKLTTSGQGARVCIGLLTPGVSGWNFTPASGLVFGLKLPSSLWWWP